MRRYTKDRAPGSVKHLEGIVDAAREGHMLVTPCRRLAPLLNEATPAQVQQTPAKRARSGAASHRYMLKCNTAGGDATAECRRPRGVDADASPALTSAAAPADGAIDLAVAANAAAFAEIGAAANADRVADMLDSLYQAAGPTGWALTSIAQNSP